MKTLHEFHDMLTNALDAIEEAKGAEERVKNATQALERMRGEERQVRLDAGVAKAQADAHVARQMQAVTDLKAANEKERADHKTAMDAAATAAKTATDAASETLEGVNKQIAEGRAEVQRLNAAKARIRAEIVDALKGDGE